MDRNVIAKEISKSQVKKDCVFFFTFLTVIFEIHKELANHEL